MTDDVSYSAEKPADSATITAVWDGNNAIISFDEPTAPEGAVITGYKVLATDSDGSRRKAIGQQSPVTMEELDRSKTYTITVTTLATSGKSAGEDSFVLEAVEEPTPEESTEAPTETTTSETTAATTASTTVATTAATTNSAAASTSPATGESGKTGAILLLFSSLGLAFVTSKRR